MVLAEMINVRGSNNNIKLAQERARFEKQVEGILNLKSRHIKKMKIEQMLVELVNAKNSFSVWKHDVLINARKGL